MPPSPVDEIAPTYSDAAPALAKDDAAFTTALGNLLIPHKRRNGDKADIIEAYLAPNTQVVDGKLSGYVLVVRGCANVGNVEQTILSSALGNAVTWYSVKNAVDQKEVLSNFKTSDAFNPDVLGNSLRVSLVEGKEDFDTVHYVVVAGNSEADAAEFMTTLAQEQRVHPKLTLDEALVTNPTLHSAYSALLVNSSKVREHIAQSFAKAHNLELEPTAHEMHTHIIVKSEVLSAKRGEHVYLVYNDVANPPECNSGVMQYRGPLAGYTLFRAPQHSISGYISYGWENNAGPREFSMFPATTGLHTDDKRIADRHVETSDAVKKAARTRLRWGGHVSSYNAQANEKYHAAHDALVIEGHTELGVPPGGHITSTHYDVVVTALPGVSTHDMALPELIDLFDKSEELSLPVRVNSDIMTSVVKHWPSIQSISGKPSLSALFADEHDGIIHISATLANGLNYFRTPAALQE